MADEQWEHMVVRAEAGANPQFVTIPTQDLGNTQPSWHGLLDVLNHLGADGWQLVQAEGVSDDGRTGRLWLRRASKMARVAKPGDVASNAW